MRKKQNIGIKFKLIAWAFATYDNLQAYLSVTEQFHFELSKEVLAEAQGYQVLHGD